MYICIHVYVFICFHSRRSLHPNTVRAGTTNLDAPQRHTINSIALAVGSLTAVGSLHLHHNCCIAHIVAKLTQCPAPVLRPRRLSSDAKAVTRDSPYRFAIHVYEQRLALIDDKGCKLGILDRGSKRLLQRPSWLYAWAGGAGSEAQCEVEFLHCGWKQV